MSGPGGGPAHPVVRPPAVAGTFYPGAKDALLRAVDSYLVSAREGIADAPAHGRLKAAIVPHAGYVYSGPIAASAYAWIEREAARFRRVVLLGPSHRLWVQGLAVSGADAFGTPLGPIPIDRSAVEAALRLPQVTLQDDAHALEHSLEVQLPFLQRVLGEFSLVPFSVGEATIEEVRGVLELLWGGDETLILISSDLSHYYDYETARRLDAETTHAIEALCPSDLGEESACGRIPVRGLLAIARERHLQPRTVDLRSSGDTAGGRQEVVGYGAYLFEAAAAD
jgi:AmmeMemoRadiSam system protein B